MYYISIKGLNIHQRILEIFMAVFLSSQVPVRHTDNSRSPAPDIAVPRQALCYLSRSSRGLKNRRLFLQHPLFLALVNQGNHKQQNAEPSKQIVP